MEDRKNETEAPIEAFQKHEAEYLVRVKNILSIATMEAIEKEGPLPSRKYFLLLIMKEIATP